MKKIILTVLLTTMAFASMAFQGDIEFEQKDGSTFTGNLKGDEWFSWIEDRVGNTIQYNRQSENYEYAVLEDVNGSVELVPSGTKVPDDSEASNSILITNPEQETLYNLWENKRKDALKFLNLAH